MIYTKKYFIVIVLVAVIVVLGMGYLVVKRQQFSNTNGSGVNRLFPSQLGNYTFIVDDTDENLYNSGAQVYNNCTPPNIEGQKNPEICQTVIVGKYREKNTSKVVYVYLTFVTKGSTWIQESMDKESENIKIGMYDNVRKINNTELYWYPSVPTFVETREAVYVPGSDFDAPQYTEQTGQNSVVGYFLSEYPPIRAGQ